jgi:hypothetical protein
MASNFSFAVAADHGAVGGDRDHAQLVDLLEFLRLGVGGSGHARELAVHAEVVLEGDGRQGLVLAGDADLLLGFDRLVETLRPAASLHGAARELVDDYHFAVLDHVVDVAPVDGVGPQRLLDVVHPVVVGVRIEVVQAQRLLAGHHAAVGEKRVLLLLVDRVVDVLLEQRDHRVGLAVLVGALLGGPRDDQRGARLVDEDGVHLVDDGEVELALHAFLGLAGHVVAQVVEAELVVGAVGDVGVVGLAALGLVLVVDDQADGEVQEAVEQAHPFRVAPGQVVVDRDHVDAPAFQGVEVDRGGGHQGLAFAGLHLGDLAVVQDHAAAHLHVEHAHAERRDRLRVQRAHRGVEVGGKADRDDVGAFFQRGAGLGHETAVLLGQERKVEAVLGIQHVEHAQAAVARLAHHRESLGEQVGQGRALLQPQAEFGGLGGKLVVVEGAQRWFQGDDGFHVRRQFLIVPLVGRAEELCQDRFDQHGVSKEGRAAECT